MIAEVRCRKVIKLIIVTSILVWPQRLGNN